MITNNGRLKCDECGQFIGWNHLRYSWNPYGNSTMMSPPDPLDCHVSCYSKLSEQQKELIAKTAWIKPHLNK